MRDLDTLTFHSLSEQLVDVLCKKTQNANPNFFRILMAYYLSKMAASMRVKIATQDRGEIPVNLYALSLATSGQGKGHSTNIIEEVLLQHFRSVLYDNTIPVIAEHSLTALAVQRAVIDGIEEEEALAAVNKEYEELGVIPFSFDSASGGPAIKQFRHNLLMSNIGSVNLEIDEIGSNLVGNTDALTTFLELYDVGKVKQKLIKNTKENTRNREIEGRTPTNLMAYGTPDKLFDGSKVEDEFYSFLETGYARRFFFGYSRYTVKDQIMTPEEVFDLLTDKTTDQFMKDTAIRFGQLAHIGNHGKIIEVSRKVSILVIEYRMFCEDRASRMGEHEGIAKAEMSHRYFKALKLAGVYAFVDGDSEITEDNYYHAICMAEESGKAFKKIMTRDRTYVKLAKYLGSTKKEVTHVDLTEDLPFYKGSGAVKAELMQLAAAWGYKNGVVIKRSIINGIEFFTGDQLQKTDLDKLQVAYSNDMAYGYQNQYAAWTELTKLTQLPMMNWITHHTINGHRHEDHVLPGFDMVVLDVDEGVSVNDFVVLMKDYKFMLYTTKRHTPAKNRFRVIMPMNYHIKLDAADHKIFMNNIYEWLPVAVDTSASDIARKWLTHDGQHYYNDGDTLLDARLFIPKTSKSEERMAFVATYQSMTNMERWFVNNSGTGNRNNQLYRYALIMVELGYDIKTIEAKVLEMNDKFPDKLSVKEIANTIVKSAAGKIAKLALP